MPISRNVTSSSSSSESGTLFAGVLSRGAGGGGGLGFARGLVSLAPLGRPTAFFLTASWGAGVGSSSGRATGGYKKPPGVLLHPGVAARRPVPRPPRVPRGLGDVWDTFFKKACVLNLVSFIKHLKQIEVY